MLRSTRVRLSAVAVAATLSLGGAAAGPAAAVTQDGLVNVNVVNNTVQVPIGIAANVCGVQANVLAAANLTSPVNCTSMAGATATRSGGGSSGGGGRQSGLINLNITDNVIQVPVGIAANICGVQANILAAGNVAGPVTCNARGNGTATTTPA